MAKQTVLITGASGGIGLALASVFAREGHDLILVARSVDKLNAASAEFKSKYSTAVTVIGLDLAVDGAPDVLLSEIQRQNLTVDVLVNNAGVATYGYFTDIELQSELQLLHLNIIALTHLTKLILPIMKSRRSGKIMNVASTAAFMPGPLMAAYYASKAYVLSFSQALSVELDGSGITVSALCPGPTESDFQKRAAMQESKLVQNGLMSAEAVAESGYAGLMQGKTVIIPGAMNKIQTMLPRFFSRGAVAKIVMNSQQRVGH